MARATKVKTLPKADIDAIFGAFSATNPEPKGELDYVNPFTLLVAVVLSAQATDAGVNKATPALFKLADTPEKMVALGPEKIEDLIKTIGLFRTKAKNVFALSQRLVADFGSRVPDRSRGAGEPAGGRTEDRKCRAQHRFPASHHRCRYASVPGGQPHRAGAGQDAA